MWAKIFANKIVVAIIIIAIVLCICWILGMHFHGDAGEGGFDFGMKHVK